MADKLQFLFEALNRKLLIGKNEFGIIDYDGLSASEYSIESEKRINGIGERITKKRVLKRVITLEFEYKTKKGKEDMRENLVKFFSPEVTGKLTVIRNDRERSIKYEVSSFKTKDKNVHERLRCLLELACMDPYLYSAQITEPLTTLTGGWKWKFTLPFRMRQYGLIEKEITNNGHTASPIEIYFKGPALNPRIVNATTGEFIGITKEIDQNTELYINTAYGNKAVELRTEEDAEDGWDYLDPDSSFFWLQPGANRIKYESAGESLRSKGAIIYYRERFFGI